MIVVAAIVATAILGTTLSCMNTGVRVTYAISRDTEVPEPLGKLNPRYGTPAIGVWVMTIVTAGIGAFAVLSLTNLTAMTLLSNFGTFLLYGVTCIIALYALAREKTLNPDQIYNSNRGLCSKRSYASRSRLAWGHRGRRHSNCSINGVNNNCNMDGSRIRILCTELTKQRIKDPSVPRWQIDTHLRRNEKAGRQKSGSL